MKPYQLIFILYIVSFLSSWVLPHSVINFFCELLVSVCAIVLYLLQFFNDAYFSNFRYFCLLSEVQQTDLTFLKADRVF